MRGLFAFTDEPYTSPSVLFTYHRLRFWHVRGMPAAILNRYPSCIHIPLVNAFDEFPDQLWTRPSVAAISPRFVSDKPTKGKFEESPPY